MTLTEFTKAAKNFAEDSREWSRYYKPDFVTTCGDESRGWLKSCDNEHGGLRLEWARGLTAAEVEARAPFEFIEEFQNALEWDEWTECEAVSYTAKEIVESLKEKFC